MINCVLLIGTSYIAIVGVSIKIDIERIPIIGIRFLVCGTY